MKLPSREQCLEWAGEAGCFVPDRFGGLPVVWLEALIHRTYREGAEAMREEAAQLAYARQARIGLSCKYPTRYLAELRDEIAAAEREIRNLKVEDV